MFQQAGIMPIHPLRNTVAGEITKGGNEREVGKMLLQKKDGGGVLYMYQYLYHTSLDHMHLQNPTKKEKKRDF